MPQWWDRLRSSMGGGKNLSRSNGRVQRDPERIIQPLPLYLQFQRIGGNLTPQQVSTIIREADLGRMFRFVDLFNEARQKDGHLQSILEKHEKSISGLEWQIQAPESPTRLETKIADFSRQTLEAIDDLPDLIEHCAGAYQFGYATAETGFEKDGKYIIPTDFDRISQRRFVFDLANGSLNHWDQSSPPGGDQIPYPGINLDKTYPGEFVTFQPRVNGDVPVREGFGRVLMWSSLFRNWDLRDWLSLAELCWKPWRTGKYAKTASQEDINNLIAILEGMTAKGVAVYPEGTEVEVNWPGKLGPTDAPHQGLFDTLAKEMSKVVLGQTETTESSKSSGYAQAKTHKDVQIELRDSRAKAVARVAIRRQVIEPMVRMNFGPDVRIPDFKFITEDEPDLLNFAQAIKTARDAGHTKIPVSFVNDKMGIPEPVDGEDVLAPAIVPDAIGQEPDGEGGKKPGAGGDAAKPGDASGKPDAKKPGSKAA